MTDFPSSENFPPALLDVNHAGLKHDFVFLSRGLGKRIAKKGNEKD